MFNRFGHYIGPVNPCKYIDTHEILKTEIYTQTDDPVIPISMDYPAAPPGSADTEPKIPTGQYSSVTLYFDSLFKDSANYTDGTITWQISPINNRNIISNCVAVSLSSFYLQKPNTLSAQPDPFYYRRVYVSFPNISVSSAVQTGTTNIYHFEFDVANVNSQAVMLQPAHTPNTFYFTRAVTGIFELTARFMTPPNFNPIQIYPDKVQLTMLFNGLVGYNPIRFSVSSPYNTTAIGFVGLLTTPGVAVDISNFQSNDPAVDSLISSNNGLFVTNILDLQTFEIAGINATTVTTLTNTLPITMIIRKNRIAFEVTFVTLDSQAPVTQLTRV